MSLKNKGTARCARFRSSFTLFIFSSNTTLALQCQSAIDLHLCRLFWIWRFRRTGIDFKLKRPMTTQADALLVSSSSIRAIFGHFSFADTYTESSESIDPEPGFYADRNAERDSTCAQPRRVSRQASPVQ